MKTQYETTAPAAELIGATRHFRGIEAVANVDLEVRSGEVVALLGPNGAGKTTAVNLMLGLLRPTSGSARLFGGDPRDPANITRVGAMLQSSGVPDTLKVRELIDLFSAYYPRPLPPGETVRMAGLEGLAERLYGKLSGGQKQRLLFALAICGNPSLLFLDEPTVGLDAASRRSFWESIRSLTRQGRSILLTTHYLEEADALADRILVLDSGRVIARGTPAELKSRTAGCRISVLTSVPVGKIETWEGVKSVRTTEGVNGRQTLEILAVRPEPIVRLLMQNDDDLAELEVTRAGLEDAFLELTNHQRPGAVAGTPAQRAA